MGIMHVEARKAPTRRIMFVVWYALGDSVELDNFTPGIGGLEADYS